MLKIPHYKKCNAISTKNQPNLNVLSVNEYASSLEYSKLKSFFLNFGCSTIFTEYPIHLFCHIFPCTYLCLKLTIAPRMEQNNPGKNDGYCLHSSSFCYLNATLLSELISNIYADYV